MRRVEEQTEVRHWAYDPDTLVRWPLCSVDCGRSWHVATAVKCQAPSWGEQPYQPKRWCSHCSWCGSVITRPDVMDSCRQHGDPMDCPEFRWDVTEIGIRAARALMHRNRGELPPRAFAYLAEVAENQVLAYAFPDFDDLVKRVWDVRVDWQVSR